MPRDGVPVGDLADWVRKASRFAANLPIDSRDALCRDVILGLTRDGISGPADLYGIERADAVMVCPSLGHVPSEFVDTLIAQAGVAKRLKRLQVQGRCRCVARVIECLCRQWNPQWRRRRWHQCR